MGFFDISGDTIKQAEAAAKFQLVIPDTAKVGKDGSANWTEHGRVVEASSEIFEQENEGRKMEVIGLNIKIEIDKEGSGLNDGSPFQNRLRINKYALQTGKGSPKGSFLKGQYTMSNMSIHRLKAILRACGIQPDMEDGGFSQTLQSECFPAIDNFTGEPSPLIGNEFWFEIRKTDSISKKDGRSYVNYEIATVLE